MHLTREPVVGEILEFEHLGLRIADVSRDQIRKIVKKLNKELMMNLSVEDFFGEPDTVLYDFIVNNLDTDHRGSNILDVFQAIKRISEDELHPSIKFHWFARWEDLLHVGNYFTRPEPFDLVEVLLRIEEEFGIRVPDEESTEMVTVGDTVRYVWKVIGNEAKR